jgi:hypothetical protein
MDRRSREATIVQVVRTRPRKPLPGTLVRDLQLINRSSASEAPRSAQVPSTDSTMHWGCFHRVTFSSLTDLFLHLAPLRGEAMHSLFEV